jgi:glutamyl-Q tRNA(Asp) synthetase
MHNPQITQYRGRFAPSPTGPLHFGSLVAALGSYLQARANDGVWLVRIEDIDPPREQEGATSLILKTLKALGLEWDESVLYQSAQLGFYGESLDELVAKDLCYPCSCTRRDITLQNKSAGIQGHTPYPGTCRHGPLKPDGRLAIRIRVPSGVIAFSDELQGHCTQELKSTIGDFILKRSDLLFSYQLAVVIDDNLQGITEVVRGTDLLDSTPRQIFLQERLGYSCPRYMHVPIAVDVSGDKLSKQTGARGLDHNKLNSLMIEALSFLKHRPPAELFGAKPAELLEWGVQNWDPDKLAGIRSIFWKEPEILAAAQ